MVRSRSCQNSIGPVVGQGFQGAVVDRGLAFAAGSPRAGRGWDGRRSGSGRPVPPGVRWPMLRISRKVGASCAEDAQLAQHPEGRRRRSAPGRGACGLDVEDFQDVADGDVGEPAALGRDDHGGAEQDVALRVRRDRAGRARTARRSRANPSGSRARTMLRASLRFFPPVSQPASARAARGRRRHATSSELVISSSREHANRSRCVAATAPGRPPLVAGAVGAAGQPALLPGLAGLVFQPVQQQGQPATTVVCGAGVRRRERRGGHQLQHLARSCPVAGQSASRGRAAGTGGRALSPAPDGHRPAAATGGSAGSARRRSSPRVPPEQHVQRLRPVAGRRGRRARAAACRACSA